MELTAAMRVVGCAVVCNSNLVDEEVAEGLVVGYGVSPNEVLRSACMSTLFEV